MLLTCGLRRHPTRSHTAGSTLYVVPSSAPARVRHWPGQGLRSLLSGYVDTLHCLPFCFLSSLSLLASFLLPSLYKCACRQLSSQQKALLFLTAALRSPFPDAQVHVSAI